MEWKGQNGGPAEPSTELVRTEAEWAALWARIGQPAPAADLKNNLAAAVFLGEKPTGGYKITFVGIKDKVVRYTVSKPGDFAIQMLTRPYAVRLFPKAESPVAVEAVAD